MEVIHKDALKAPEAANCVGEQGKYWEMHDRLFQNQNQLALSKLAGHAEAVGVNIAGFQECLDSGRHGAEVRNDIKDGQKAGVHGTPTVFLVLQDSNSQTGKVLRVIQGARSYAQFSEAIEPALSKIGRERNSDEKRADALDQ